jgi:hypothetical protein
MGDDSIGSPLETFSDESNPVLIATQPRLIRPEALRVPILRSRFARAGPVFGSSKRVFYDRRIL